MSSRPDLGFSVMERVILFGCALGVGFVIFCVAILWLDWVIG